MKNILFLLSTLLLGSIGYSQTGSPPPFYASNPNQAILNANFAWYRGGNNLGGQAGSNNILGTRWASDIWIMTNNAVTARFSHNNGLNGLSNNGDGLRITNPNSSAPVGLGEIDIFTSIQNHTEIRWGGSGNIRGAYNRFEIQANYRGLYFNTREGQVIYKFARLDNITAVIGTNDFWRIGMQTDVFPAINGARRLEVVDNTIQFRLQFGGVNSTAGPFTDFLSNANGNLQIMSSGSRVGINLNANPTANLDVNGNVRIRNVQTAVPNSLIIGVNANGSSDVNVRRLDFTGNANQVLLGNGTWGTAPSNVVYNSNNGIVRNGNTFQLGASCTSLIQILTSSLTENRVVFLNGKSFWMFSGVNQTGGVGFGAQPSSMGICSVGNTVEISANNQSAYGNANASGLRFTKLTSSSSIVSNGTNGVDNSKVLTVDQNGDVVLTDVASSGGSFTDCSDNSGAANLLADSKVNFDNNSMYFVNPTSALDLYENRLGIGYTCGDTLPAKLSVYHEHDQPVTVHTTAISGINRDTTTFILGEVIGVYGASTRLQYAPLRSLNIGGDFYANNAAQNYGVRTQLRAPSIASNTNNFGLFSLVDAPSSSGNFGVYSRAGNGIGASYAIFGIAAPLSNSWAGYFSGNVSVQGGSLTLNGSPVLTSDSIFKTDVNDLTNAISLITQLQPRTFLYDTASYSSFGFDSGSQMGFIAQELEQVLPTLVSNHLRPAQYDSLGIETLPELAYKGVEYEELIPLLVAGMKEQENHIDSLESENDSLQTQIDDLNNRLTSLENCLSGILPFLCQLNNSTIQENETEMQEQIRSIIDVQLSNRNSIILNQNVPNPFAESTVITYSVPASVGRAQIHFYDMNGILINSVEITERVEGQLNVYGNDLSSGIYTYSLVADGKVVSTKKMMKND